MHDNLDQVRQVFPNAHVAAGSQPDTQCGGAARARARPRLDLWTHTVPDEPCLELTVRLCGKGNAESAAVILSKPRSPSRSGRRKDPEDCSRENMDSTVQERSVRRAKKNIRLSAKVMGADRLLTLTSRKYLYTLDRFWEAFNEFNRLMRKRLVIAGSTSRSRNCTQKHRTIITGIWRFGGITTFTRCASYGVQRCAIASSRRGAITPRETLISITRVTKRGVCALWLSTFRSTSQKTCPVMGRSTANVTSAVVG